MKVNTDNIDEMLNDKATYWIAGGAYDMTESAATKEEVCNELQKRCLDLDDFVFGYFMDHMLVSKKRKVIT